MDPSDRENLHSNRVALETDLQVGPLLAYMVQDKILATDDCERINSKATRREKAALFLDILETRGPQAFSVLLKALKKHHIHLYNLLHDEQTKMIEAKREANIQDAAISRLQDYLVKYYLTTLSQIPRIPWDEDDTMDIDDIFTDLKMFEEIEKPAQTSRQDIQSLQEVLKQNDRGMFPTRVLVRGKAGSGKTTVVSKLAVDWANALQNQTTSSKLGHFKFIFCINLREIEKDQTLASVFESQILDPSIGVSSDFVLDYITKSPEKVLIVLDGYDEYADYLSTEVTNIIRYKSFRNVCVVITTRPWKTDELSNKKTVHVHVEISGLAKENIKKFIAQFFGVDYAQIAVDPDDQDPNAGADVQDARSLVVYLESKKMLSESILPIILLFVCLLWKNKSGQSMPETQTQLYQEIVGLIMRRYTEKTEDPEKSKLEVESSFQQLGKIALHGLVNPERGLIFDARDIEGMVLVVSKCGLLSKVKMKSKLSDKAPKSLLSFPHKTIQEFFAGKYVATALEENRRTAPDEYTFWHSHADIQTFIDSLDSVDRLGDMQYILQYACGLSPSAAKILLNRIHQVALTDPLLSVLYRGIMTEEFYAKYMHPGSTEYQRVADFNTVLLSCLDEIISNNHILESDHTKSIRVLLKDNIHKFSRTLMYKIKRLDLMFLQLSMTKPGPMHDFLQFMPQTQGLHYICVNPAGKEHCKQCGKNIKEIIECNDQVKVVIVTVKDRSNPSYDTVFTAPLKSSHLEVLHLNQIRCSKQDISLSNMPNLTVIRLRGIGLNFKDMTEFLRTLGEVPNLTCLDISENLLTTNTVEEGIYEDATTHLAEQLIKLPKLKRLSLCSTNISPTGISALAKALHNVPSLHSLHLSNNDRLLCDNPQVGETLSELFNAFQHTQNLQIFDLSSCFLGKSPSMDRAMQLLSQTFKYTPKLSQLHLADNNLGDSLVCLGDNLQYVPELVTFELSFNNISPEGIEKLKDCVEKHLPQLTQMIEGEALFTLVR